MKVLFVRPNKDAWGYKPIGLSLLMALEKQRGNEVRLFDTTRYDFGTCDSNDWGVKLGTFRPVHLNRRKYPDTAEADFEKELHDFRPDEVLFTVMSDEVDIAGRLTRIALSLHHKVVWGGVHPTVAPEDCPQNVTIHRGEALKSRYKVKCLDDLPYVSWDEYDDTQFSRPYQSRIYRMGDHMINWGCPHHCAYCVNSVVKKKVQRYGNERIVAELKHLKSKHRIQFFKFHDEDFLARPTNSLERFGQLYADQVGLPFVTETNPKTVTEEKTQLMKDMGCVSVSMGLETGNENLRANLLKRADTINDVIRAFHTMNRAGIRTSSFNMLGIPFETWGTYGETVELNRRAEVQAPYVHYFYPFPGTPLREVAIKEGYFNPDTARPYRRDRSSMTFPNLTDDDLKLMRDTFIERIHHASV